MDTASQEQIRKVQKFSRYARGFCLFLFVTLGIAALLGLGAVLFGPGVSGAKVSFGAYTISGDHFVEPGAKAWGGVVLVAVFAILFTALYHLYALFGNFIRGGIYTRENVQHIRQVGVLMLEMSVFQLLLPIVSLGLLNAGVIDEAAVIRVPDYPIGMNAFSGFITSGVILLASWIMDLGRQTRDEADQLRRDAELVV